MVGLVDTSRCENGLPELRQQFTLHDIIHRIISLLKAHQITPHTSFRFLEHSVSQGLDHGEQDAAATILPVAELRGGNCGMKLESL